MTVLPSYLATFLASILLSVSLSTTAIIVEQYSPRPLHSSQCICSNINSYNANLPVSAPSNRCAKSNDQLNWKNWLTGSNRSSQLHFMDLLELLYGHTDKPLDNITDPQS